MGSYYKWQARDVKPEEKAAPLTGRKKWANWFYYYKWHLLAGIILLCILIDLGKSALGIGRVIPDYQIAYIGSLVLPEDTASSLENALAELGQDQNRDGKVIVQLNQYPLLDAADDDSSAQYNTAKTVMLMADMEDMESYFFLVEDPASFQKNYQILAHLDGSPAAEDEDPEETLNQYAVRFSDCPVLAGLDLGTYREKVNEKEITGSSMDLVSGLYLAKRVFVTDKTVRYKEGCDRLWNIITEGAGEEIKQ